MEMFREELQKSKELAQARGLDLEYLSSSITDRFEGGRKGYKMGTPDIVPQLIVEHIVYGPKGKIFLQIGIIRFFASLEFTFLQIFFYNKTQVSY